MLDGDLSEDSRERIENAIKKIESRKDLYSEKKRGEIRDLFYNEGVDITYKTKNKDGSLKHGDLLGKARKQAKKNKDGKEAGWKAWIKLGTKALIVTGRSSSKKNVEKGSMAV